MKSFFENCLISVIFLLAGGLLGATCVTFVQMHIAWDSFMHRFIGVMIIAGTLASGFATVIAFICAVGVFTVREGD